MNFKQYTITPKGRNRYGTYASTGNLSNKIVQYNNGGNSSTGGGSNTGNTEPSINWVMMLTKTSGTFDGEALKSTAQTISTQLMGWKGIDKQQTFIGNINSSGETSHYGISGLTGGMGVTVSNNGSSATTLNIIAYTSLTATQGTLIIPCNVYVGKGEISDEVESGKTYCETNIAWYDNRKDCMTENYEFTWSVNKSSISDSNFSLDLTNENASVNVDSSGVIYTASTASLSCTAKLYYGQDEASGETYSISINPYYSATGISIDSQTGVLSFDSSTFNFNGNNLPINVNATIDDKVFTKTMNINKSWPGSDGTPATSKWIVLSCNEVKISVDGTAKPTYITAYVMQQIGSGTPEQTTSETIYYSYGNVSPIYVLPTRGAYIESGDTYVNFALRQGNTTAGTIYEQETVQILYEVKGDKGDKGDTGDAGQSGQSAYRLTLSNDNASINCNSALTIYEQAVRPYSIGKLFYGSTLQTGATYQISTTATGVTSSVKNGVITICTSSSTFNFTGYSTEIIVSAFTESQLRDVSTFNISKSIAGENGEDAVSYWIELDYTEAIYDPNTAKVSPTAITATAKKQVGSQAPQSFAAGTIKYSWFYRNTGSETEQQAYPSTGVSISASYANTYNRLRFYLYSGSTSIEWEDVDILMEGLNGDEGSSGRTGAAVRGPIEWQKGTRRFCNGEPNSSHAEDEKWIDVVIHSGVTYKCVSSYTQNLLMDWDDKILEVMTIKGAKNYFQSATTFDFVATKLLLADNAKIKFTSTNELYLMNSADTITGGARGSDSANTINFWAGAEDPINGKFKVFNDGSIDATKGKFGCTEIGADTKFGQSLIASSASTRAGNYEALVSPLGFKLVNSGGSDYNPVEITIAAAYPALGDSNAPIQIYQNAQSSPESKPSIWTNGLIEASNSLYYAAYIVPNATGNSQGTVIIPTQEYGRGVAATITQFYGASSAVTNGYIVFEFSEDISGCVVNITGMNRYANKCYVPTYEQDEYILEVAFRNVTTPTQYTNMPFSITIYKWW